MIYITIYPVFRIRVVFPTCHKMLHRSNVVILRSIRISVRIKVVRWYSK